MMRNEIRTHSWYTALLLGLVLSLLAVGVALAAGNISDTDKWAWGTNVGWINFAPDTGGVTVYSDRLEGDAWGENIGWIRFKGTAQDNTSYGVNNDGVGNLSGYAWGTNVGWINFAPANGGVWADPLTGDFSGYAWGENVGWIHLQNTSGAAYKVTTVWHGDLLAAYQNNIAAVITTHRTAAASSNGLIIANSNFLNDAGDGIIFGHNNAAFANVTTNLPSGVDSRWARIWQLDVNDGGTTGGQVTLTFDISEAGGTSGNFDSGSAYFLLKRATGSSDAFTKVTVVGNPNVSDDQLTFTVDVANLGSEFTLGATADSPTAVTLLDFDVAPVDETTLRITWSTASEVDVQGFHLWRSQGGERSQALRISQEIIETQGDMLFGADYLFMDGGLQPESEYSYWLQEITAGGSVTEHGPVTARPTAQDAAHRFFLPFLNR
jgi:hypothetical protein